MNIQTYLSTLSYSVDHHHHKHPGLGHLTHSVSRVIAALKGSQEWEDYILLYSGVPTNKRAAAGIAIMIKAKYRKRIHSYMFVNERILQLRYKLQRGYLTLLAVYAPEEGKTEQMAEFYRTLQDQINKINKNDYVIVA